MNRLLLFAVAATLLAMSSCDDASVNVAIPHDVAHAAAYFRNVPWTLVSAEWDSGAVNLPKFGPFELIFQDTQFIGKAACNDWAMPYHIVQDSVVIGPGYSTLLGCGINTPINLCDLLGAWKVTIRVNTLIFSGAKGRLTFYSDYWAPVDGLPFVERTLVLTASDDTLFTTFSENGALPRLEMRADRTFNLYLNPSCDWSDAPMKGEGGCFGVSRDSGIVMSEYWGGGSCGVSRTPADRMFWRFKAPFMKSSRISFNDSRIVFLNPQRRTYYWFTAAH
jgi:hypothetical protein